MVDDGNHRRAEARGQGGVEAVVVGQHQLERLRPRPRRRPPRGDRRVGQLVGKQQRLRRALAVEREAGVAEEGARVLAEAELGARERYQRDHQRRLAAQPCRRARRRGRARAAKRDRGRRDDGVDVAGHVAEDEGGARRGVARVGWRAGEQPRLRAAQKGLHLAAGAERARQQQAERGGSASAHEG
jgi:hypothetical protein